LGTNGRCEPLGDTDVPLIGVDRVCYNTRENVEAVTGPGSFQAMDASYPVAEQHWPDWLKQEVERSSTLGLRFG
jgi:hypothetical protein